MADPDSETTTDRAPTQADLAADDKDTIPAILKSRPWQDWAFLILLIVLIAITYNLLSGFQQLPSPVYGGDIYFHFGVINNIYSGNAPWTHNHFINEYAHYPWIMHLIVAYLALLTGMQVMTAAIYFPILTTAAAATVAYLLGIAIFNNRSIALLMSLYWATFQVPNTAASPFAELVIFPLFILALARSDDTLRSRIWAGITFGLCGLAQVVTWIAGIMTLALMWAGKVITAHASYEGGKLSFHPKGLAGTIWRQIKWFLPIAITGLPIALLFWGPPIFAYHGATPNNWSEYVSLGPTLTFSIALDTLRIWFFNTDSWLLLITSAGTLLGLALAFRSPRRFTLPLIVGLVTIIGLLHPFIKEVGIGFYAFGYIYDMARGLLLFTSVYVMYKSLSGTPRKAFYFLALAFFIINAHATFITFDNDRWVQVGRSPNYQYNLAEWITASTPNDAVFLSPNEETGFALNAMTGRKVVIARRTHASPFVDVNQRAADAAIILYGNNDTLIAELVGKYGIKYLYEDFYSSQAVAQCGQGFDRLSDPAASDIALSCLMTDPSRENYIKQAGITTTKVHTRIDPASTVAPRFAMIAIKPGNMSKWLAEHSIPLKQVNAGDGVLQRLAEIQT